MAEHVSTQSPDLAARPTRTGKLVVGAVVVLATALAFLMVRLTEDDSLSPKQRVARADIRKMHGLFRSFYRLMGRFPTEQEGFNILVQSRVIAQAPVDPWGRPYVYRLSEQKAGIISYGADGVPGGKGEDADITSGGVEEEQP